MKFKVGDILQFEKSRSKKYVIYAGMSDEGVTPGFGDRIIILQKSVGGGIYLVYWLDFGIKQNLSRSYLENPEFWSLVVTT